MSFYLDTSAIVSLLTQEPRSDDVDAWMSSREAETFAISHWVVTEVASALSLKVRTRDLTLERRMSIFSDWSKLQQGLFLYPIEPEQFIAAAQFCDRAELGLRGGDALHIAIARAAGCSLVTLDQRMAEAASALGVPVAAV